MVFESQVDELKRAADGTVKTVDGISGELDAVKATLARSTADPSLYEIADSIQERLWHARFAPEAGAYGPTPSQRES